MQMRDALFYWLQMKVIWEARPTDYPAQETAQFFAEILREDHQVTQMEVAIEDISYKVTFLLKGEPEEFRFDRQQVEQLLQAIESDPKYNRIFNT